MFEPQTIANAPAVMVVAAVDDGMFLGVPLIMVLMSLPAIFCAVLAASRVLDRCAAPCDSAQGAFGHGSARRRFGSCAPAPGTADAVRLLAALEAFGFPVAELSPDGIADRRRMLQTGVDPGPPKT